MLITASVDLDTLQNELIFTFGPHGCQFSEPVEIWLDYSDLNTNSPILYYIDDNGDYIQQQPAQIDNTKKWLKINVNHFSRYALARS